MERPSAPRTSTAPATTCRACRRCACLIDVARARARFRRQRRGHLSRQRRHAHRPPELDLCGRRNRADELRRADVDYRQGRAATCCGCAPTAPTPTAICSGPLQATHVGAGDVEGFDSRLTGASQPAAARCSPTARWRRARRSTGPASKATCRAAGKPRSTATASFSASPSRAPTSAMCLKTCSFSTATTSPDRPLRSPGPGSNARGNDQCRPGQCPKGKTWYWAGVNQPGRDMIDAGKASGREPGAKGAGDAFRSNTASTIGRRWACLRARC